MFRSRQRHEGPVSTAEVPEAARTKRPIAFFIPGLEGGGAQRVFVTLVNKLVTMTDHPIHLVTSRGGGVFENLVDERVVRIVLGRNRASRSILRLARYIRRERPVGMISTLDYANVVFLLATIVARVPLRRVVRDANIVRTEFGSFSASFPHAVLRVLMRASYRLADDIIVIAKDVEWSLLSNGIGQVTKMRRISNPVQSEPQGLATEPAHSLPSRPFILAVGRLVFAKGFDNLIKAFAQLQEPDLNLVLLGEGPDRHRLSRLASDLGLEDRVLFPGFVHNVNAYLRTASLFVLSSRWEGFSNVLVEALAVGVPIVSTDCPGSPRDVLHGGRLGRLVPVDGVRELATAMDMELRTPTATSADRISRAKEYSSDLIAAQYLRVLFSNQASAQSDLLISSRKRQP